MTPNILIIAGSDSSAGAGLQADIKTAAALDAYAATAITAVTCQNTHGVFGCHAVPADEVAQQVRLVLEDMNIRVIKTGMLVNADIINAIADIIPDLPLVVDPVMLSKNGSVLLAEDAISALREKLFPRIHVLTPNIPEAETLLGRAITDEYDQIQAAQDLRAQGPKSVLVKGGHGENGDQAIDILATPDGIIRLTAPRLPGPPVHGTGCTLATAIATGLAHDLSLLDTIIRARKYLQAAIANAEMRGHGHPSPGHLHPFGK